MQSSCIWSSVKCSLFWRAGDGPCVYCEEGCTWKVCHLWYPPTHIVKTSLSITPPPLSPFLSSHPPHRPSLTHSLYQNILPQSLQSTFPTVAETSGCLHVLHTWTWADLVRVPLVLACAAPDLVLEEDVAFVSLLRRGSDMFRWVKSGGGVLCVYVFIWDLFSR